MSESVLTVEGDDVHLRWMREAMHMVGTGPIVRIPFQPKTNSGRRCDGSQGSPSRLCVYPG